MSYLIIIIIIIFFLLLFFFEPSVLNSRRWLKKLKKY